MSASLYIEEIFESFYQLVIDQKLLIKHQDLTATYSFYDYCAEEDKQLTQNQANYLLKILSRYQNESKNLGLDYSIALENPKWKKIFRTIDLSKKVYVEVDQEKKIWICLKFPYSLKETFEKEFSISSSNFNSNFWDHTQKVRKILAYKHNIIQVNNFVVDHNFEIDNTFLNLISSVEEIWQQQDNIIPHAILLEDEIILLNGTAESDEYFRKNKTGKYEKDIFLAKSMNFVLKNTKNDQSIIEKICSNSSNKFWIKENEKFFNLHKTINGISCVLIDRNTKNILGWLKNFVSDAEKANIKSEIKICFRDSNTENSEMNQWIKNEGLGGKTETGKIFLFLHKPPKWLFKNKIDVKIIATNCFVPPLSDSVVSSWMFTHPCLMYLGDIKPTAMRGHKIVNV